jgi:hypothetical protein
MGKRKGNLAVVEDVEDDDFEDDFEDDEEEEVETARPPRPGSKRTPAAEDEDDDEEEEEDFETALAAPTTAKVLPTPRGLTDDQLVIELTDLIMQGDDSEMTSILIPIFTGRRGGKIAKQLVRESRDRAIAKIKRVANVAQVNIDTFDED